MRFPIFFLLVLALAACGEEATPANTGGGQPEASDPDPENRPPPVEVTRIKVQHVLIGFQKAPGFRGRAVPNRAVKRKKADAEKVANDVLSRARGGFNFSSLVRTFSDDQLKPGDPTPGTYTIVDGAEPVGDEFGRTGQRSLVKGFCDVAFSLEVGEIGMAPFHAAESPFGWHIIKRIE